MEFDIVSFGSAVVDIFIDTEFNSKTKQFSYPAGEKILAHNLKEDIGGGATNVAVAFSRFGFKTGCICKIGNDNSGRDILKLFKKEKIKFLGAISKEKTGHSIILDSRGNDRTILTYKGPGNSLKINEIPKFKTRWLYYSSMLGESFKSQEKLAKSLSKVKTKVAFNPSGYLIRDMDILPLLKITDVLILNKEEAEMLCRKYKKKGNLLISLRELGPKIVVVTNKDKPVYCYDGIKKYSIKPHKVKVVERTGAGDAFASGFVSGVVSNKSLEECLKLGLEEGESVIGQFGAKNNLIRRKLK